MSAATTLTLTAPGSHDICVTANGTDAGGTGSVTACVSVLVLTDVDIDIKRNSDPNSINTKNNGTIPVAIFGAADFDVTTIDQSSLRFRATGTEASLRHCGSPSDINGDGFADFVCHFNTQQTGFSVGDTEGILSGTAASGPFQGTHDVRVVH